jgi:hypothetical protein
MGLAGMRNAAVSNAGSAYRPLMRDHCTSRKIRNLAGSDYSMAATVRAKGHQSICVQYASSVEVDPGELSCNCLCCSRPVKRAVFAS